MNWLNKTIKHKNNTDVAFKVMDIIETENGIYCKGMWVNIAYKNPFIMHTFKGPLKDRIFITKEQIQNWKEIEFNE